ncbi:MAG TPA: VanZ family protein [Methylophilaceae bacterium]|jgi:VanZ family protein|nr:VanZ family protein [Methylophilaceae bacterium]
MQSSREKCVLLMPKASNPLRTPISEKGFDIALRVMGGAVFIVLVASVFLVGAQPVAVGLFPAPYDKLAHFIVFFAMTVSAGLAGLHGAPMLLFMVMLGLGMADELHQLYLPGRSAGWDDLTVDFLAVSIAVLAMPAILKQLVLIADLIDQGKKSNKVSHS